MAFQSDYQANKHQRSGQKHDLRNSYQAADIFNLYITRHLNKPALSKIISSFSVSSSTLVRGYLPLKERLMASR